jgi:hypothetical protein
MRAEAHIVTLFRSGEQTVSRALLSIRSGADNDRCRPHLPGVRSGPTLSWTGAGVVNTRPLRNGQLHMLISR